MTAHAIDPRISDIIKDSRILENIYKNLKGKGITDSQILKLMEEANLLQSPPLELTKYLEDKYKDLNDEDLSLQINMELGYINAAYLAFHTDEAGRRFTASQALTEANKGFLQKMGAKLFGKEGASKKVLNKALEFFKSFMGGGGEETDDKAAHTVGEGAGNAGGQIMPRGFKFRTPFSTMAFTPVLIIATMVIGRLMDAAKIFSSATNNKVGAVNCVSNAEYGDTQDFLETVLLACHLNPGASHDTELTSDQLQSAREITAAIINDQGLQLNPELVSGFSQVMPGQVHGNSPRACNVRTPQNLCHS